MHKSVINYSICNMIDFMALCVCLTLQKNGHFRTPWYHILFTFCFAECHLIRNYWFDIMHILYTLRRSRNWILAPFVA